MRMPTMFSCMFSFLLILSMLTPFTMVSSLNVYPIRIEKLYLAAVTSNNTGIVIPVTIKVFPGNGNIQIVDPGGKVSVSTVLSIKYALGLASIMTGREKSSYNYEIIFPKDTDIAGTSATLPFTLVFAAILTNTPIREDFSATGILMPNTIVGNVSGIDLKYEATSKRNIQLFLGPYIEKIPGTNYIPVITAYEAYNTVTKTKLLGSTQEIIVPRTINYQSFFVNATKEFLNLTRNILSLFPAGYASEAWKFYRLSEKYSNKGDWYTAASYGFRSYIDALSAYAIYLEERAPTKYKELLAHLEKWYDGNYTQAIKDLEKLGNYTYSHLNLWNIDIYVNAFIRYSIAVNAYQLYKATGSPLQIVLALARIITAKQWASIPSIEKKMISYDTLSSAYKTLHTFTNITISYFVSMKYISNQTINVLSAINHIGNVLVKFAKLAYIQYILISDLLSLQPPVFSPYLTPEYIVELNKTVSRVANYLLYESGTPILSALTTVDVGRTYAVEMENLTTIDGLLISELTLLTMYKALYMVPVYSCISCGGSTIHLLQGSETTSPPVSQMIFYVIAIILISMGAFLAGFSIKKYYG